MNQIFLCVVKLTAAVFLPYIHTYIVVIPATLTEELSQMNS